MPTPPRFTWVTQLRDNLSRKPSLPPLPPTPHLIQAGLKAPTARAMGTPPSGASVLSGMFSGTSWVLVKERASHTTLFVCSGPGRHYQCSLADFLPTRGENSSMFAGGVRLPQAFEEGGPLQNPPHPHPQSLQTTPSLLPLRCPLTSCFRVPVRFATGLRGNQP